MASLNKKTTTSGQTSRVKSAPAKKTKPEKPEILLRAEQEPDVCRLLQLFGVDTLNYDGRWRGRYTYKIVPQKMGDHYAILPQNTSLTTEHALKLSGKNHHNYTTRRHSYQVSIAYAADDGTIWRSALTFYVADDLGGTYNTASHSYEVRPTEMEAQAQIEPFTVLDKMDMAVQPLQFKADLLNIIHAINAYAYDFVLLEDVDPLCYLMAPYLETLHKAGYVFAKQFFHRYEQMASADVDCLNRLCKRGRNPAEIFKTSKAVYKVLGPHETDMAVWDTYRKLDKFGRITQETIRQAYEHAMSVKNLGLIHTILGQQYNGKPIFDWDTLYHYLVRLDKFEAIGNDEALLLLRDYLNMCRQLGMRPRVDGDSLKREHDVAARLCLSMRNQKLANEMQPACQRLAKYDYREGVYFIRSIRGFDDLLSEATQQHSCLVSCSCPARSRRPPSFRTSRGRSGCSASSSPSRNPRSSAAICSRS